MPLTTVCVLIVLLLVGCRAEAADFPFQPTQSDTMSRERAKIEALIAHINQGIATYKEIEESKVFVRVPGGYQHWSGGVTFDPLATWGNVRSVVLYHLKREILIERGLVTQEVPIWWVRRVEARIDSLQNLVDHLNSKPPEPLPSIWKQLFGR